MSIQRIYIIGAGVIARSHAVVANKLPVPVQLAVADPMQQTLDTFQAHFPEARIFQDAQTMLAEPAEPDDIVIVATPPFNHCDLTLLALASGRHVLCEKPLAFNREEALRMLKAARSAQKLLGCCSDRYLGMPSTLEAQRLLQEGQLGDPYYVRHIGRMQRGRSGIEYQPGSRWFLDRSKNGGGILIDWGPYDFTMLNTLFQPRQVDVLGAWLANPLTETDLSPDTVFDVEFHAGASVRFHLDNGKTVMLTYERSTCTHGEAYSVTAIDGLKGSVKWDWLNGYSGTVTHGSDQHGMPQSTTQMFRIDHGEPDSSAKPLHYFYRRVHGEPSLAVINEQAVFNFLCVCAIYDCAYSGQPQTLVREGL